MSLSSTVTASPEPPALSVSHLTAGYRKTTVLRNISFDLQKQSITGLLGPNGAGKSTLFKILATITHPTEGHISIHGLDPKKSKDRDEIRRNLSYLPQNFTVDERFTVEQFIEYCLWMRKFPKQQRAQATAAAIEKVDLLPQAHTKIKALSGGMRQRAGIAAAIAGDPALILLDEPTVGLDPDQRFTFRELLKSLRDSDTPPSILLSTHLVEDVVSCANEIVVINHGEVRYAGSTDVLSPQGDRSIDSLEENYRSLLRNGQ